MVSITDKGYIAGVHEHLTSRAKGKSIAQPHAEIASDEVANAALCRPDVGGYVCATNAPGIESP